MNKYLYWNVKLIIERFTIERFVLHIINDENENLKSINNVAVEIIVAFNGQRSFDDVVILLSNKYKEDQTSIKSKIELFIEELKNDFGIKLLTSEKPEDKEIKIIGTESYYPKAASIEITDRCNLKCLHCYGEFGGNTRNDMELVKVKKLLLDLSDMGVNTLELTGGDISVHKNLLEILEYALSLNFLKLNLLTNGILLKKDVMNFIIENKEKFVVQIDLHSLNDNYLEWFTKAKDTLTDIKENILYLSSNGVRMRIASIFTKNNVKEVFEIADWVFNNVGQNWGVGLVENLGRACDDGHELFLSVDELRYFQNSILSINEKYPNFLSIITDTPSDNNCGASTSHVVINAKGDIKLCTMDNLSYFNTSLGNCFENEITNLYDQNKEFIYALSSQEVPRQDAEECKDCEYLYSCSNCIFRNMINMKKKGLNCNWYKNRVFPEVKQKYFGNENVV